MAGLALCATVVRVRFVVELHAAHRGALEDDGTGLLGRLRGRQRSEPRDDEQGEDEGDENTNRISGHGWFLAAALRRNRGSGRLLSAELTNGRAAADVAELSEI